MAKPRMPTGYARCRGRGFRSGAITVRFSYLYGATDTARYQAMAEAGANLPLFGGLTLTPRAALAYSLYHLGGFDEQGGETALRVDDLSVQRLESRVGARLAGELRLGGWALQPQLQADLVRTLSGADAVRFLNAPDFAFALPLADGDRTWAEVRGGLTMANGPVSFGAGIETSIGGRASATTVRSET